KMEKKGIIVGATIQNSYTCYQGKFVATILINVQRGKLDCAIASISKIPHVFHVYSRIANHAVAAIVILESIEELEQVKQTIKRLPFILAVDVRVWIGQRTTPENLSVLNIQEPVAKKGLKKESEPEKKADTKIDEIDTKIIEKLAADGRVAFEKIAKPLGVSTDTVLRRYERLRENGNLKVVIQINPTKIGYYAYAIFNVSFSHETLDSNTEIIAKIQDINFITKMSGSYDYAFSLMIKDINQFVDIQEQIASLPGLMKMEVGVDRMFTVWPLQREFISTF
ncbi:MAG: Lrp/AsnC family transcriptional regulator, partial [Chloroflexi bacterium]|nr:Lrp/AsnC family transcriptional regulator [Chloroflexota bacterium]